VAAGSTPHVRISVDLLEWRSGVGVETRAAYAGVACLCSWSWWRACACARPCSGSGRVARRKGRFRIARARLLPSVVAVAAWRGCLLGGAWCGACAPQPGDACCGYALCASALANSCSSCCCACCAGCLPASCLLLCLARAAGLLALLLLLCCVVSALLCCVRAVSVVGGRWVPVPEPAQRARKRKRQQPRNRTGLSLTQRSAHCHCAAHQYQPDKRREDERQPRK
jgi:hypothetical protein